MTEDKEECECGGEMFYDVTTYNGTYYCKECGNYADKRIIIKTIYQLNDGKVAKENFWWNK